MHVGGHGSSLLGKEFEGAGLCWLPQRATGNKTFSHVQSQWASVSGWLVKSTLNGSSKGWVMARKVQISSIHISWAQ